MPNEVNAHPHSSEIVSVVHNGIIENSDELKKKLEKSGKIFKSNKGGSKNKKANDNFNGNGNN